MDSSYDNSMRPQNGDKGGLGTGGSRGGVDSGMIRGDINPRMVSGDVNSGMGRSNVNPGMVRGDVNSGAISGNVNSSAGLDVNASAANNSNINVGADIRANVAGNHGVDFSANLNNNSNVDNGGFGNGNGVDADANNNGFGGGDNANANNNGISSGNNANANNIGFGNENNANVSVNNDDFSNEDSQVQGDSFYTDFKQSVDALSANDGDIILGGKKKKKWLIFGVIGGIVAVVGVVALVLAIILTSEPKTGTGIKAKNYEEAFNIYANYFLFGERSKQAVNWDATVEDGFESYFRKVVDKPFEIEAIKSGEKTVGGEIAIMDADYEVFQGMFMKLEDRSDEMTSMVEDYSKKIKFLDKYYNVGVPDRDDILEVYEQLGYDKAEEYVWQVASEYNSVGVLYNNNIADLVGRYGDNQLATIEEYRIVGCIVDQEIDYGCATERENADMLEYLRMTSNGMNRIFAIVDNTQNSIISGLFSIRYFID